MQRVIPAMDQVQDLIHQLAETETALHELIAGQADAVIHPINGTPVLLRDAQAAICESEARYHRLVTGIAALVLELTPNGTIFFANDTAARMIGRTPEALRGQNCWTSLFPDMQRQEIEAVYARLCQGGIYRCEVALATAQETPAILEMSFVPRRSCTGILQSLMALGIDITERRQAEAALRDSEARFRAAFEQTAVGMAYLGLDGRFLRVNHRLCEITGYPDEELLCKSIGDITHAEDWERERPLLDKLLAGETTTYTLEKRYLHKTGHIVWVNKTGTLIRDTAGLPIYLTTIVEDITERKRAEAALRVSEANLARAQAIAHIGSWTWDTASGIIDGSDETYRLCGLAPGDLFTLDVLRARLHPDDRARVEAVIRTTLEHGRSPEVDYRIRLPDGSERVLSVRGEVAARDAEGNPCTVMGTIQDITERKRAEEAVRSINATLEERVTERTAELESFSYSLAHDLRTPLRGIEGFSQLLLEDYGDVLDAAGKDYLQRIRAASQRMAALSDALLKLSRISRAVLRPGQTDLSNTARQIARQLQETQPQRQVDWVIADGLRAEGDPRLLEVVLENLLDNAWKFTGQQSAARIEFGATQTTDDRSVFFVRDDGAGFDMAYADKLFKPFSRLHGITEFEGVGIGLAIAARIIHRHGGRIWAEGAPGQGAVFYFTLGGTRS
ncbi:MAG: PAS domain S-box protein [Pseudomonadota bacterium]